MKSVGVIVQSKRVQKNIGTIISPWITRSTKGNKSNNNNNDNNNNAIASASIYNFGVL